MKKLFLGSVVFSMMTLPVLAADMAARPYTKAPAYVPAPVYNWTGFYIGGHLGAGFRDGSDPFGNANDAHFVGGGQVGADYQFGGNWVLGVEAQYSYVDRNSGTFAFPGGTFSRDLRGLASVTGRLGYSWGATLLYAKGGYAYADTRNNGVGPFQLNGGRDGYTVGGGIEYMFAPSWSAKIEYQYYDFDRRDLFVGAPLVLAGGAREAEHTAKVGLNYRFNSLTALNPFAAR